MFIVQVDKWDKGCVYFKISLKKKIHPFQRRAFQSDASRSCLLSSEYVKEFTVQWDWMIAPDPRFLFLLWQIMWSRVGDPHLSLYRSHTHTHKYRSTCVNKTTKCILGSSVPVSNVYKPGRGVVQDYTHIYLCLLFLQVTQIINNQIMVVW